MVPLQRSHVYHKTFPTALTKGRDVRLIFPAGTEEKDCRWIDDTGVVQTET